VVAHQPTCGPGPPRSRGRARIRPDLHRSPHSETKIAICSRSMQQRGLHCPPARAVIARAVHLAPWPPWRAASSADRRGCSSGDRYVLRVPRLMVPGTEAKSGDRVPRYADSETKYAYRVSWSRDRDQSPETAFRDARTLRRNTRTASRGPGIGIKVRGPRSAIRGL
jgi:hypothetical protein